MPRASSTSTDVENSVVTLPARPKVVSSVPSTLNRASAKSAFPSVLLVRVLPAAIILPSACIAIALAWSPKPEKLEVTLPPIPKVESRSPGAWGVTSSALACGDTGIRARRPVTVARATILHRWMRVGFGNARAARESRSLFIDGPPGGSQLRAKLGQNNQQFQECLRYGTELNGSLPSLLYDNPGVCVTHSLQVL